MDVECVFAADFGAHLSQRLQEGQALDVAHRAADFDQDDLRLALVGHSKDIALNLVGDVGDDLDCTAQIVAAPFAGDDLGIDPAGGDVRRLVEADVDEPLIVAQVEIGLRAVVGHEYLTVLIGRHGPRIDVDVGVELLGRDGEAPRLQQPPQRRGRYALADRTDYPTGEEDVLGHRAFL